MRETSQSGIDPQKLMSRLALDSRGLVAAIAQDAGNGEVLMLGWMNTEALAITLATGKVTYYSRSRKRLWEKGETSGNTQTLRSVHVDCDGDALLLRVDQKGPACHTGAHSCFFTGLVRPGNKESGGDD